VVSHTATDGEFLNKIYAGIFSRIKVGIQAGCGRDRDGRQESEMSGIHFRKDVGLLTQKDFKSR
jgi:hypothetical protein